MSTEAESRHRDGTVIIWREETGWQVKGTTNYGTDVVSFTIAEVWKHWFVIQEYATPRDQPDVNWV